MAKAVNIRYGFIDTKGKTSNTSIHVPTGETLADYIEFGEAFGQLLANVTIGEVTQGSVAFAVDLSGLGLKTVATTLAAVAKKLRFRFLTAATGFFAKMQIPSLRETQVGANSDDINQADGDIAAAISLFEDGVAVTAGTMTFTNGRGHDITAITEAKEKFLRRRRR